MLWVMTQCQRSDSLKPFLNVGKVDLMCKRVVFGDKRTEKKIWLCSLHLLYRSFYDLPALRFT